MDAEIAAATAGPTEAVNEAVEVVAPAVTIVDDKQQRGVPSAPELEKKALVPGEKKVLGRYRNSLSEDGGVQHVHKSCGCAQPETKAYQYYLSFLTLGVIYGDIGTSPLYTFSSIFSSPPVESDVMGALSAMLWSLMIVVILKYVGFVLLADDHGEGGTFALATLVSRGLRAKISDDRKFATADTIVAVISLIGVSAVLSDGILTPAISVMGAVQGLSVASPSITNDVVTGASCVIFVFFFLPQKFGTSRVSFMFSPIITVWFLAIASIGVYNISFVPSVLKAFNPAYAIDFLSQGFSGWSNLGAIFLTLTGAEALFADLGHFNACAIRLSALLLVFPSLMLCYCGQAAALIVDPTVVSNTFYNSIPNSLFWPMLILATLAAVIASQAMVTATFSIVAQAMRLQYFPRMTVHHTDQTEFGQIYVPEMNYFLMVLVLVVVAGFQNATTLGYAYGVTVSLAFLLTALLYALAIVVHFNKHWTLGVLFFITFGFIDANFLAANLLKFPNGGWFSVTVTVVLSIILLTWRSGRKQMVKSQQAMTVSDADLFILHRPRNHSDDVPLLQMDGVNLMICFSSATERVPAALVHFLKRLPVRPRFLALVTITVAPVPFVEQVYDIHPMLSYENVFRVLVYHGYSEVPPSADKIAVKIALEADCLHLGSAAPPSATEILEMVDPTYVVGNDSVYCVSGATCLHRTFVEAFSTLLRVSRSPLTQLHVPPESTLEIGVQVEI